MNYDYVIDQFKDLNLNNEFTYCLLTLIDYNGKTTICDKKLRI